MSWSWCGGLGLVWGGCDGCATHNRSGWRHWGGGLFFSQKRVQAGLIVWVAKGLNDFFASDGNIVV
jgi:hypothetical protein